VSKEFKLNTHDLPRRAGEMKEYHLVINLENPIGIDVIAVPAGTLNLDLRLESVAEGILATGDFEVVAKGECIRCLDPIDLILERNFQELYSYKPDPEIEEEDQLLMDGDILDLEAPIRDAIVLALPINPLCDEDCEGLCSECGEKWRELPEDHAHQQIDARWGALAGLLDESQPEDSNEK
jgi:uncharacterized protein